MCMDWLRWQYNHVTGVVPPLIALAFVTKTTETCKSKVPNAIQEKSGEINQYWSDINGKKLIEKGEQTADIHHNVRVAHGSIYTICDRWIECHKMHTTDIQTMLQSNFELSDDILNFKYYISNMSFARCLSVVTFESTQKSKDMSTLYRDFIWKF
jgi:hypothetical protein